MIIEIKGFQLNNKKNGINKEIYSSKESNNEYKLFDEWGTYEDKDRSFPFTFASVSKAACDAIISTLHKKTAPNPNIVSNAMSRSVFHYRPIQNLERDIGRMGIEIDGVRYLLNDSENPMKESMGLIRLVLLVALNLSQGTLWESYEIESQSEREREREREREKERNKNEIISKSKARPIVLYFTTMKEVLLASKQLKYLKKEYPSKNLFSFPLQIFDRIEIKCLGDDIPKHMQSNKKKSKSKSKSKIIQNSQIDPTKGLIFMVQPTSTLGTSSSSLMTPSESFSSVPPLESIQKTMIRATLNEIPVIMISPRFQSIENVTPQRYVPANKRGGIDSSGYQHSDIYGGFEPARPSPWLLRDFNPSVFAWVATSIGQYKVGLYHSVMDTSQAWHIFNKDTHTNYQYMASTKPSSGRPSKSIMEAILYHYLNKI